MANINGAGAVTIRDLIKTALRMRPDRIIVGEVRGGEAVDMLQALIQDMREVFVLLMPTAAGICFQDWK